MAISRSSGKSQWYEGIIDLSEKIKQVESLTKSKIRKETNKKYPEYSPLSKIALNEKIINENLEKTQDVLSKLYDIFACFYVANKKNLLKDMPKHDVTEMTMAHILYGLNAKLANYFSNVARQISVDADKIQLLQPEEAATMLLDKVEEKINWLKKADGYIAATKILSKQYEDSKLIAGNIHPRFLPNKIGTLFSLLQAVEEVKITKDILQWTLLVFDIERRYCVSHNWLIEKYKVIEEDMTNKTKETLEHYEKLIICYEQILNKPFLTSSTETKIVEASINWMTNLLSQMAIKLLKIYQYNDNNDARRELAETIIKIKALYEKATAGYPKSKKFDEQIPLDHMNILLDILIPSFKDKPCKLADQEGPISQGQKEIEVEVEVEVISIPAKEVKHRSWHAEDTIFNEIYAQINKSSENKIITYLDIHLRNTNIQYQVDANNALKINSFSDQDIQLAAKALSGYNATLAYAYAALDKGYSKKTLPLEELLTTTFKLHVKLFEMLLKKANYVNMSSITERIEILRSADFHERIAVAIQVYFSSELKKKLPSATLEKNKEKKSKLLSFLIEAKDKLLLEEMFNQLISIDREWFEVSANKKFTLAEMKDKIHRYNEHDYVSIIQKIKEAFIAWPSIKEVINHVVINKFFGILNEAITILLKFARDYEKMRCQNTKDTQNKKTAIQSILELASQLAEKMQELTELVPEQKETANHTMQSIMEMWKNNKIPQKKAASENYWYSSIADLHAEIRKANQYSEDELVTELKEIFNLQTESSETLNDKESSIDLAVNTTTVREIVTDELNTDTSNTIEMLQTALSKIHQKLGLVLALYLSPKREVLLSALQLNDGLELLACHIRSFANNLFDHYLKWVEQVVQLAKKRLYENNLADNSTTKQSLSQAKNRLQGAQSLFKEVLADQADLLNRHTLDTLSADVNALLEIFTRLASQKKKSTSAKTTSKTTFDVLIVAQLLFRNKILGGKKIDESQVPSIEEIEGTCANFMAIYYKCNTAITALKERSLNEKDKTWEMLLPFLLKQLESVVIDFTLLHDVICRVNSKMEKQKYDLLQVANLFLKQMNLIMDAVPDVAFTINPLQAFQLASNLLINYASRLKNHTIVETESAEELFAALIRDAESLEKNTYFNRLKSIFMKLRGTRDLQLNLMIADYYYQYISQLNKEDTNISLSVLLQEAEQAYQFSKKCITKEDLASLNLWKQKAQLFSELKTTCLQKEAISQEKIARNRFDKIIADFSAPDLASTEEKGFRLHFTELRKPSYQLAQQSFFKRSAKEQETVDEVIQRASARKDFNKKRSSGKSIYRDNKAVSFRSVETKGQQQMSNRKKPGLRKVSDNNNA